jgi:hypothetical protein
MTASVIWPLLLSSDPVVGPVMNLLCRRRHVAARTATQRLVSSRSAQKKPGTTKRRHVVTRQRDWVRTGEGLTSNGANDQSAIAMAISLHNHSHRKRERDGVRMCETQPSSICPAPRRGRKQRSAGTCTPPSRSAGWLTGGCSTVRTRGPRSKPDDKASPELTAF